MQIDLFDEQGIKKMNRQSAQVMTRKFSILERYRDLAGINQYLPAPVAQQYKMYLQSLLKKGRHYSFIGESANDSLFELETLAIAEFCRELIMIGDFSDCLDLALHYCYGCDIEDIRSIKDYSLISKSVLNCNFNNLSSEMTFARLINASSVFAQRMAKLSMEAQNDVSLKVEDQMPWMIFQFYQEVLSMLHRIKFYTTMEVCNKMAVNQTKGVIRSMSFAAVAARVDSRFDEIVTIHDLKGVRDDYQISFRTYGPYEYIGEVLRNESNRNLPI